MLSVAPRLLKVLRRFGLRRDFPFSLPLTVLHDFISVLWITMPPPRPSAGNLPEVRVSNLASQQFSMFMETSVHAVIVHR